MTLGKVPWRVLYPSHPIPGQVCNKLPSVAGLGADLSEGLKVHSVRAAAWVSMVPGS